MSKAMFTWERMKMMMLTARPTMTRLKRFFSEIYKSIKSNICQSCLKHNALSIQFYKFIKKHLTKILFLDNFGKCFFLRISTCTLLNIFKNILIKKKIGISTCILSTPPSHTPPAPDWIQPASIYLHIKGYLFWRSFILKVIDSEGH